MTTPAYSELYLSDARRHLANAFDYAVNDCEIDPALLSEVFVSSPLCRQFETGAPSVVSGRSGEEMILSILQYVMPEKDFPEHTMREDRTPEYWAGWSLAYYQWFTAKRFKDIFSAVPLSEIIGMYPLFHEMDESAFVTALDERCDRAVSDTKLKMIREAAGLSQRELAERSGVKIRMIQLYEQRVNDIDKAQSQTLYKISRVLGCYIEDLLEHPEK